MALVALLKGVNVGGHRTFRPSVLATKLKRFDVVNVGAAGTFVIRKRITRSDLRAELLRQLPFQTDVIICGGTEILHLTAQDPFALQPRSPAIVRFVSVLAKRRPALPQLPLDIPSTDWSVEVLEHQGQFVCGLYRREMKAIKYLGQLDRIFGASATTRNWNTMLAVAEVLKK